MTWYEEMIEEAIRPFVRLLRDNGFNTYCSCGHDMYVELECYDPCDITALYTLLMENGYVQFNIFLYWETHPVSHKWIRVELGQFVQGTS